MDNKEQQLKRLVSRMAAPDLVEDMTLFGQFIGDWEFSIVVTNSSGIQMTGNGEWHFVWTLDGRAIQDVRILSINSELTEYGTTIRFYDKKLNAWHCAFIDPMTNKMLTFIAKKQDDTI